MRKNNDRHYLVLTLVTLLFGGGSLIAIIYGPFALVTALPFLLIGAFLIVSLWYLITAVSRWRDNHERADQQAAESHLAERKQKNDSDVESNRSGR